MTDIEEWASIPDYEGLYEVSTIGRVRSLDRMTPHGLYGWQRTPGIIRKLTPDGHGYPSVKLMKNTRSKTWRVHQLVLIAFVGPRPPGMEGCHHDDDKLNSRLANLRWDTRQGNRDDFVRNGLHHQSKKTHCPRGHLLLAPNLLTANARLGMRSCRVCSAERKRSNRNGVAFDRARADRKYAEWMAQPNPMKGGERYSVVQD